MHRRASWHQLANRMSKPAHSSRRRFQEFRRRGSKPQEVKTGHDSIHGHKSERPENRSFWRLTLQFFKLLRGHRVALLIALLTITISTLLKLAPPAITKVVI